MERWWAWGVLAVVTIWVAWRSIIGLRLGVRLRYPPSPGWCWPVIGHFHIMMGGRPLHRVLSELAGRHGGLYYMKLGRVHTVVVSTSEWAREFLHGHDREFCERPQSEAARRLFYGSRTLVMMEYGPTWRQMRKLYTLHLLTGTRIAAFDWTRQREVARAVQSLNTHLIGQGCARPIPIRDFVFSIIGNMMTTMLFSKRSFPDYRHVFMQRPSDHADVRQFSGFKDMVLEMALLFGAPIIGDVIPWLRWLDLFPGYTRRMDQLAASIDGFLERLLSERQVLQSGAPAPAQKDFLELLIEAYPHDAHGHTAIKSILLDLLSAGTETSTTTVEWAMAELLRNPECMEKLQQELRMASTRKMVEAAAGPTMTTSTSESVDGLSESAAATVEIIPTMPDGDDNNLPYLQAVIKETLRLHPPLPLVIRQIKLTENDAQELQTLEIRDGLYRLPKGSTRLVVNVWAIGRDVAVWGDNAHVFCPDRFLTSGRLALGGQQQHFDFLPFGYGRRGCPGSNLGLASVSLVLANLVHHFDWRLPPQLQQQYVGELSELPISHTAPMALPLLATPSPCS